MKIILALLFSLFMTNCQSQENNEVKINTTDIDNEYKKNINQSSKEIWCKIVGDSLLCCLYQDTVNLELYIGLLSRETYSKNEYSISSMIDVISIGNRDNYELIQIGSLEDKTGYFIVSIEEYDGKNIPDNSANIIEAWICNLQTLKFNKVKVENLYRINEGYYCR